LSSRFQKYDLGSGKNLFRIPDPGVKKALDPGSGEGKGILMEKLKERKSAIMLQKIASRES
jgi:hypothetical protein